MVTTYAPQTTKGTTTTFLPRITPFTGPSVCSDFIHNLGTVQDGGTSTYIYAWDPLYGLYVNSSVTCQPAEATTWALGLSSKASLSSVSSDLGNSVTILAPFSCPANWTVAWSSTPNPSTSATVCCPSHFDVSIGYYLNNNFGTRQPDVACIFTLRPGYQDPEYAILITETDSKSDTMWTTKTSHISKSNVLLTAYSLSGWNMQAPETSADASDASQYGSSSGLNSGAKAGIGVGVVLGVVLAVMIATLLYFRHRRKQKSASTSKSVPQGHDEDISLHEASGQPCHELLGSLNRPELHEAAGQPRHELHGPIDRSELHGSPDFSPQELDRG